MHELWMRSDIMLCILIAFAILGAIVCVLIYIGIQDKRERTLSQQ